MSDQGHTAIVANGGWVEKEFRHKPRALRCLGGVALLFVAIVSLLLLGEVWAQWLGFALLPIQLLLSGIAIRFFLREPPKETILVPNPDVDLRKLY
jgi:hypothetical protein